MRTSVICAWCGCIIEEHDNGKRDELDPPPSHGICELCKTLLLLEQALKGEDEPDVELALQMVDDLKRLTG